MTVSCVIAAYNEERTLACVIEAVRRVPEIAEIVVVSDGSTDGTADVARRAGADVVVRLPKNLGKGGAVMAGARRASHPVLLLIDADLEHLKPSEISGLIRPVLSGGFAMSLGVLDGDLLQNVLPILSGIRALRKNKLLSHSSLATTRFGFERALTDLARRERWMITRAPFTGVKHLRKQQKYGFFQAYRSKTLMVLEVLGIHKHGPRNGRPSRRALALVSLIAMMGYIGMGMTRAGRAAGSGMDVFPDPTPQDRYLMVAAHADDEVLAAGGLIHRAATTGANVWVVFGTNGDANRLAASIGGKRLVPRAKDFIAEGELRQREAVQALERLGVLAERIMFLGYPDRGLLTLASVRSDPGRPYTSPYTKASASPYAVSFRPHAQYTGSDVLRDIEDVMLLVRPTVVFTHHDADRHGDHKALNLMVRQTIRILESKEKLPRPKLYTYLVHAWDYPRPLRFAPEELLLPPKSLQNGQRWVRFDLTPYELSVKQEAMKTYRSQLDSPYLRLLLMSFMRQNELFAVTDP
jgi:LmbE family N-acetylglucosaminyl deacetylase